MPALTLVSTGSNGLGNKPDSELSQLARFSPDGTLVVFDTYAHNRSAADSNGREDIYLKDLTTGALTILSTSGLGVLGDSDSFRPATVAGVSLVVVSVNDAPTMAGATAGQAAQAGVVTRPFSSLTIADPDVGRTETVTVSFDPADGAVTPAGGFTGRGGVYTGSFGSAAAAEAAVRQLAFTPAAGRANTTIFTVTVGDTVATVADAGTSVTANPAAGNTAPTVGAAPSTQAGFDDAPIGRLHLAEVSDPDAGAVERVTVTFDPANGTLSGPGVTGADGVYSFSGSVAQVNAVLNDSLVFTPTRNQVAPMMLVSTVFGITAFDGQASSPLVHSGAVVVLSVNDAPTLSGAATVQTATSGQALAPFATVILTDPDVGQSQTVTVSFAPGAGVFTAPGFTGAGGSYSGTFASAADAQEALRAALFTPTAASASSDVLTVSVQDAPNGSAAPAAASTTLNVAPAPPSPPAGLPSPALRGELATEFQNLSRALLAGADAQNSANPLYAQAQAYRAVAARYDAGQITPAQAELQLVHLVDGTTSVAVASYAFFTGYTPTAAGLNYLVHSSANPTDLNDPYYQRFSTENRFINFAVNLATGPGAGAASFADGYGGLSLRDATAKAYVSLFGVTADAAKLDALLNTLVPDGLGGQETRATYFAQYGGDGANGQGTKAAMIGWLLAQSVSTGTGVYGAADLHYLSALAHGVAPAMGSELPLHYGADVNLVGVTPQPDPVITG